ncbi:MAG: redoxin family protein [Candidatus Eremiobacteraeota bacterium]|nr:redoxin family protein [Candidatus Eremiobacteraeota bacterium]
MKHLRFALACAAVFVATIASSSSGPTLQPVLSANDWLNARATAAGTAGKVVVLDVFTVDCYNCQNVVPSLRALYAADRGRGLAVIGIHTPETPAEREAPYVKESLARQGIVWPVAIDNSEALWNAYGVTAWPTQLFFDRRGRLRKTIVGDSQDADVRATVEQLLSEK